ncbi:membrane protein [Streptomyces lavendulae subsp. lavendulae]|uniref:PP2C family protein-serine/threonine phosphatase n=1 Tax=Streptomyces lavendulae TaxID=1914 RepID=UPI0024A0D846|nr:PP2C family protein-serine/threonine phosphatase [Streptomyces lavendulae]GLV87784.1 membrane protein [Streptomyces lavendulae subsp. lavendulae]
MKALSEEGGAPTAVAALRRLAPALVVLVVVSVIDLATPAQWTLQPVMSAAPALAAATCSLGGTALVGTLALALANFEALAHDTWGDNEFDVTMVAIAAVCLASLLTCHARLRQQRELLRTRLIAEAAQRVLMRPMPPRLGLVNLAALYIAAQEDAQIGGDVYECLDTPFGARLLIGDVRGKGLAAVEASAALLTSFREAAHTEETISAVASRLEAGVQRYVANCGIDYPECFATALIVEILPHGTARIVHCGHPAALMISDGHIRVIEPTSAGLPLGLSEFGDDRFVPDEFGFARGDRLLLCTDGVSECRDREGLFYPLPERLSGWTEQPITAVIDALHVDLLRHCGGRLQDDAAVLAVERV